VRVAGRQPGVNPSLDELYDAFRHGRADRPALPLLDPDQARRYVADVRGRALDVVGAMDFDPSQPLLDRGFVVGLVVQHEHQHDETMLATLQLMAAPGYRPIAPPAPAGPAAAAAAPEVRVPGGSFEMGTDDEIWAYDNERPAHTVEVAEFWIDTFPVTNGQFLAFVEDGCYDQRQWWSEPGWAYRQESGLAGPQFWQRHGPGSWARNRFGWVEDVPADDPVQHVCWYEADAYARWAGKRLPSEAEWEKAARGPASPRRASQRGRASRFPWGDADPEPQLANLGGRLFRPAPIGAYPGGTAPCGAQQMMGDVWEWTSSDFGPYPGFTSFPYPEYSEVFFGSGYKVLRGGSWATDPAAVRATFRNWDLPIRRQIFAGFRCARDS
jgi:iron(II)-dependent oxidoreductase